MQFMLKKSDHVIPSNITCHPVTPTHILHSTTALHISVPPLYYKTEASTVSCWHSAFTLIKSLYQYTCHHNAVVSARPFVLLSHWT